jgi:hypothetical protein
MQHKFNDMKSILPLFALLILGLYACQQDKPGTPGAPGTAQDGTKSASSLDSNQLARITYLKHRFFFGNVTEGDIVEHDFEFINTGKIPLQISNCRSTCGCTIPEWPKDPIPPGGKGAIKVRFDTADKHLGQHKEVIVTANSYPGETKVMLDGIVDYKKK